MSKYEHKFCVYKYVSRGEVIYVGKSKNGPGSRVAQHQHEERFKKYAKAKVYVGYLDSCNEMSTMELLMIFKYRPILNVACKPEKDFKIEFEEPKWEPVHYISTTKRIYPRTPQSVKPLDEDGTVLSYPPKVKRLEEFLAGV